MNHTILDIALFLCIKQSTLIHIIYPLLFVTKAIDSSTWYKTLIRHYSPISASKDIRCAISLACLKKSHI